MIYLGNHLNMILKSDDVMEGNCRNDLDWKHMHDRPHNDIFLYCTNCFLNQRYNPYYVFSWYISQVALYYKAIGLKISISIRLKVIKKTNRMKKNLT